MAYQIPNIAGLAAARNNRRAQAIQDFGNKLAAMQKEKNKREAQIVKDANARNVDFLNYFEQQPKSSNQAFNSAAEEYVRKASMKQEEMYRNAFGAEGSPQARAAYNAQVMKDKRNLKSIGAWMTLGNAASVAITENQSAADQDTSLGAFTRGNDINKLGFQSDLANSKFTNFLLEDDANGNINLKGFYKDQDYQGYLSGAENATFSERNLTGDVQAHEAGQAWFTQIKQEDLLQNKLGKIWNDTNPAIGLNNLFQPEVRSKKYLSNGKWVYTEEKVYNPVKIKNDLLTTYSKRLDTQINGEGFDKTWDQLYKGGYIRNAKGEFLEEGDIAWNTVKQIKNISDEMFMKQYGDLTGDNKITQEDRDLFVDNMKDAARQGLANYFSETMSPQNNQVLKTQTTQQKKSEANKKGGYSPEEIAEFRIHEQAYLANKEASIADAELTNAASLRSAMVKQLNDNSHLERLGGVIFADYETAMGIFENTGQLDYYRNAMDKGSIYALSPTATVTEGTKKLQYVIDADKEIKASSIENAVGNQEQIQLLLNNGIDVDELSVDYFTQLDKSKEKKSLPTN
tara:strand:+ start:266 stop:1978 length:1713 start_codon:yes stop_codon:yes gene_type:complete